MSSEDKPDHVSEESVSPPAEATDQSPPAQLDQPQDPALDDAELDKVSGVLWRLGTFVPAVTSFSANRHKKEV